jgi:hypothetical protein
MAVPLKLRMAKVDPKWVRPHTVAELFEYILHEQKQMQAVIDNLTREVAALKAKTLID